MQPYNASADQIQGSIEHCLSGALKYIRHDGGEQEQTPVQNTIRVMKSGEYWVRGDVALVTADGETITEEYRMTLRRCGASVNKPFCDNSHREARFRAASEVADNSAESTIPSRT